MTSTHPFRPPTWQGPRRPTAEARSTEAPMDYEYSFPRRIPLSSPFVPGGNLVNTGASISSSSSMEPPRKRPHWGEEMEWESTVEASTAAGSSKGVANAWGGQGSSRRGGQFLFQPPQGIDVAPPASFSPSASPSLPSAKDLGPDSFGLPSRTPAEEGGGRGEEPVGRGALMPISTNGLRHEQRRRERSLRRRKEAPKATVEDDVESEGSRDDDEAEVRLLPRFPSSELSALTSLNLTASTLSQPTPRSTKISNRPRRRSPSRRGHAQPPISVRLRTPSPSDSTRRTPS